MYFWSTCNAKWDGVNIKESAKILSYLVQPAVGYKSIYWYCQYQYQYFNIRAIYSSNMKKALFSNNSRFFWQYIAKNEQYIDFAIYYILLDQIGPFSYCLNILLEYYNIDIDIAPWQKPMAISIYWFVSLHIITAWEWGFQGLLLFILKMGSISVFPLFFFE